MNEITFNTEYINKGQTTLNDIMCKLRQLMIDDIKTTLENNEKGIIKLDEPVHIPYKENDSCYAVWLIEDEVFFCFSSYNTTKRSIENVGFELLNHVYNTLQNEGYFNSKNYNI